MVLRVPTTQRLIYAHSAATGSHPAALPTYGCVGAHACMRLTCLRTDFSCLLAGIHAPLAFSFTTHLLFNARALPIHEPLKHPLAYLPSCMGASLLVHACLLTLHMYSRAHARTHAHTHAHTHVHTHTYTHAPPSPRGCARSQALGSTAGARRAWWAAWMRPTPATRPWSPVWSMRRTSSCTAQM